MIRAAPPRIASATAVAAGEVLAVILVVGLLITLYAGALGALAKTLEFLIDGSHALMRLIASTPRSIASPVQPAAISIVAALFVVVAVFLFVLAALFLAVVFLFVAGSSVKRPTALGRLTK